MPSANVQAGGVIHDLGYRGYDGPRLGRAQIVRALTWHSFRSAFGIGRGVKGKIIPVLTFFVSLLLIQAEGGQSATSAGARVAGLFSPFTILDGVRVWLGGSARAGLTADPGRYGPLYGVLAVLLLAACLGGLAARYRKVSQS